MRFGAALSEHPVPAEAVGEVVGAVLDRVGPAPDLAVLVVSPALVGALDDVVVAVRALLAPGTLVGAVSASVVGGAREVEHGPAVALWAGRTGPVTPVRLATRASADGVQVSGVPAVRGHQRVLLVLGDPYSLPAEGLLAALADDGVAVVPAGGLVAGPTGPGAVRLVLDGAVHDDGGVGVLLPAGTARVVVGQGCRPVGEPMVVTEADGPTVLALAGRPALDQVVAVGRALEDDDRERFAAAPHLGVVLAEGSDEPGTGDFLVRAVAGVDAERRGLHGGRAIPVGTTVQLHVRDPAAAEAHLRAGLAAAAPRPDEGALLFTCTARGHAFFGEPDRDAEAVVDHVGPAVAGLSCAAEVGPAGDRSHLLAHTATVVLVG